MMIKNLITIAENFCGTRGFQNYYNAEGRDILKNGELSCAVFVSVILCMLRIIDGISFTVEGLLYRIERSELFLVFESPKGSQIRKGDIVIWDSLEGSEHRHIGFALSNKKAISNRSSSQSPGIHPIMYTGLDKNNNAAKAKILKIYRLKK